MASGEETTCRAIFKQWVSLGNSIAGFADQILRPTFERIGDQWSCDQLEVYQERRGCEIAGRLIQEFRGNLPAVPADAPLAMGAAPSDDPYTLPGQLIEAILLEGGWRAVNLGANIPFASLSKAINRERPRLFWLSVSSISDQTAFVEQFQKFSNSIPGDVALVVGGRALSDRIRPQLKFHAHCDNMRQLSDFASALRGVRHTISPSSN
jgi:methanogenic corrinoid protein MtbC1